MTARYARNLVTLLLAAAGATSAQEAKIRATLPGDAAIWVGQRVTLVVELLAPGYFSGAVSFDIPDPDGVLLMPPQGRPLVSSETIDGVQYSVQRHELWAWPMRAGDQAIPAVTVQFGFKRNPLQDEVIPADVQTETIPLTVAVPPGAEKLGTVISARNVDVKESWNPEPGNGPIPAGKAFTRTITFTAPGVPGMVFPPFPAGEINGLGIYTKQELDDETERGSFTGLRRDEITYVCQRPGEFTIPATRFTWFDLDAQALRTVDLPARTLTVIANPAMTSDADASAARSTGARAAGLLVALLGIGLATGLLAARSRRVRRFVAGLTAPLYPVHLQTLNPVTRTGKEQQ
jgi:hypothetical protein